FRMIAKRRFECRHVAADYRVDSRLESSDGLVALHRVAVMFELGKALEVMLASDDGSSVAALIAWTGTAWNVRRRCVLGQQLSMIAEQPIELLHVAGDDGLLRRFPDLTHESRDNRSAGLSGNAVRKFSVHVITRV